MNRYSQAVADSQVNTARDIIENDIEKIVAKTGEYDTPEVWRFLFNCVDLTSLETFDSQESVAALTRRVNDFDNEYPQFGNVASICVYSNLAEVVKNNLDVTGLAIDAVAGGFPSGQTFTAVKVADVALACAEGVDEIDVVMNLGYLRDGNYEDLCDELIELRHTAKDKVMKVILETGALPSLDDVKTASVLALWSGADFIKTSTGKVYPGASLEAAMVMCECIKEYHRQTGRKVGFKVAGGIRTPEEALKYYALVKEVLGEEWLDKSLFRIGASKLANALLARMLGEEEVSYF